MVPKVALFDVDGVLTTGHFIYNYDGKALKIFGPDDNDALSLLRPYLQIRFITGDKKGFEISRKRIVDDMNYPLDLVSTICRIDWIKDNFNPQEVIYMGDGIFDHYVMNEVAYSIAPANADTTAKSSADFVTFRAGGDRAVAEACLHIRAKFFQPFDPLSHPKDINQDFIGWSV
tara:strand:- start:1117 stop:1638 length:522 start_codon:yes stop_codon:yes gene_type:complete